MSKYLLRGNYVGDGIAGLMKDGGTKRRTAAEAVVGSVGGTVESFYYAFGDTDLFAIVDIPDEASAIAASLKVNASGSVMISMTRLLTPEDIDAAVGKDVSYSPPGT